MLITISTTHAPATDLGYLLHKNPARVQSFSLNGGTAWVFYPEASDDRCTCALLFDLDPVELSRRPRGASTAGFSLFPYVNDRPYVASSFLSVAIAEVFGSALNGRCKDRPELVDQSIPLEITVPVVPSRRGEEDLRALFTPLGYEVEPTSLPLDPRFPAWDRSHYYRLRLTATLPLRAALSHLYVLLPVLDNRKHYWVGDDEVEKLLRNAESWLPMHPEKDSITRRYLRHRRSLVNAALARLIEETEDDDAGDVDADGAEESIEQPIRLNTLRLQSVCDHLLASGATRVLDLGCGEGKLLSLLMGQTQFQEIVGMDVVHGLLSRAADKLRLDRLSPFHRARIQLLHGSLVYHDRRLRGYDAAALVEVIEHLDPFRLEACARSVFADMRPGTVVVTTPNREYNVLFPTLAAGSFRHADHRFEWTRDEFSRWCNRVGEENGYDVLFHPIGDEDEHHGPPTQMAVFTQRS